MKKTKDTQKPSASKAPSLPLDDPRWLPIGEAHRRLLPFTASTRLASLDLMQALEHGLVRCLSRSTRDGGRGLVPASFWTGYELSHWSDGLMIAPRRGHRDPRFPDVVIPVRGSVFYVWRPDFEKRWSFASELSAPPEAASSTSTHGRQVMLALRLLREWWSDGNIPVDMNDSKLRRKAEKWTEAESKRLGESIVAPSRQSFTRARVLLAKSLS